MFENLCKSAIISLALVLAPIKPLILIIALVVGVDTLTGILRSHKLGVAITSRRFYSLFKKTFVYQGALILTFLIDKHIINEFVQLVVNIDLVSTKIIAGAVLLNELLSIKENVNIIFGINLSDYVKELFHFSKNVKEGLEEVKQYQKDSEN